MQAKGLRWSQGSPKPSNRLIRDGQKCGASKHVSTFNENEELLTFNGMEESSILVCLPRTSNLLHLPGHMFIKDSPPHLPHVAWEEIGEPSDYLWFPRVRKIHMNTDE